MIKKFAKNTKGRDFVVGDIHGCFELLKDRLEVINFNTKIDRLFCVGDMVDRGADSLRCLEWINKKWFHSVRGNHEQMAIDAMKYSVDTGIYLANGGAWFLSMTKDEQQKYADEFSALPIVIEVDTGKGLVGIVHADCPFPRWADVSDALTGENSESFAQMMMWDRTRANNGVQTVISGVHRVIVGHTPVDRISNLGNVTYIDTGAVFCGKLSLFQIQ